MINEADYDRDEAGFLNSEGVDLLASQTNRKAEDIQYGLVLAHEAKKLIETNFGRHLEDDDYVHIRLREIKKELASMNMDMSYEFHVNLDTKTGEINTSASAELLLLESSIN